MLPTIFHHLKTVSLINLNVEHISIHGCMTAYIEDLTILWYINRTELLSVSVGTVL